MKYLVYTPFRCGSSFVTHFIEKNHDIQAFFPDNIPANNLPTNMVVKTHNDDISALKPRLIFDHVITCIRKPTDIFMSAYIKDFKTPDYPYTYEKEPCVENVDDMVDHFLSFDWSSFNWCSYDFNFKQIQQLTDLDIWNLPVNVKTGVSYYPGKPALTIVTHQTLFNDDYFQHFQQFCFAQFKFKNLTRGVFSYRNADIYDNLYHIFKSKIPQSFFEKYKDLDNQIISKFFDN
jgi:hypothetical protein